MDNCTQIKGYEGLYEINKIGNVFSLKRKIRKKLKPILHHTGYYTVRLYKDKKFKEFKVHRLVAETYNAKGIGCQVNHINGIKTDNNIYNLEYCSNRENCTHRSKTLNKSSKYPGVTFCKTTNKWRAYVYNNRIIQLGRFNTEKEAYNVYKKYLLENNIKNKYAL